MLDYKRVSPQAIGSLHSGMPSSFQILSELSGMQFWPRSLVPVWSGLGKLVGIRNLQVLQPRLESSSREREAGLRFFATKLPFQSKRTNYRAEARKLIHSSDELAHSLPGCGKSFPDC